MARVGLVCRDGSGGAGPRLLVLGLARPEPVCGVVISDSAGWSSPTVGGSVGTSEGGPVGLELIAMGVARC